MTMEGYEEEDLLNSSLTNLQWLQHINMNLSEGLGVPRRTVASSSSSGSPTSPAKEERQVSTQRAGRAGAVDFTRNSHIKPPYSYATLICMAIRETAKHKITLSAIYNWIMANFAYYRNADPSWQNSIRHNLSLNKCFVKVPRDKDEPGKGGFWTINADYEEYFKNGVFKRRKAKKKTSNPPKQQQSKPTSGGVYRTMNVYHSGKPRSNNGIIRLPSSFTLNPQQEEKTRPCNLKLNINRTCQRSSPYSRPPTTTTTTNNNNNSDNSLNLNNNTNLNSSSRCSALNLNCSLNKSGLLNTSTVDEQPPAWDLVLKDIQLNSASSQATEVMKRTEDDFFKTGPSLNFESLHEDLTSPELNELVRDIESLIDGPVLREPELMIKGEKVSSNSVLSSDPYCSSSTSWSNIMEELNLGGGIGDFLDSPLNALV